MIPVPGYEVVAELGRGGFATVYRATQLSVGRDVAIKLLSDPDPPPDLVRRFTRESRAVGALSWHPHIATVIDAGATTDGRAFIAFELLTGGSLDDAIASGPLSWRQAVAAMIQIADAVEAAHRADVLHRDIKPANILRDRFGHAKLADFGIASMQDGTKTATGAFAVTVAHAAPEVFDGIGATPLVDVYALGSTLHTLIAGRAPFEPPTGEGLLASIGRIASQPAPRLASALAPAEVADVALAALAKSPGDRWPSAAAFGRALQGAQRNLGESVTAMPIVDDDPVDDDRVAAATVTIEQPPTSTSGLAQPEWFVETTPPPPPPTDEIAEPDWF